MWTVTDSPVGELRLVARAGALVAIEFSAGGVVGGHPGDERADDQPLLRECARQLAAYFAGSLTRFDLPLAPHGTGFQRRVWAALEEIGYGETASYADIARRLGMTAAASRAVGLANGRNPLPIVVPCHRVVGADGSLTGYAGGLERKRMLLDLEVGALF